MKRVADLSVLLDENPATYYWMGFLVADGHFYETAIKLHLSELDRNHMDKFRQFVNYTGKAKGCTMNSMNSSVVKQVRMKFGVSNRKTFEPCDLLWMKDRPDLFFSFVVGMIDGDGHLAKRRGFVSSIAVKLHRSWLENLEVVERFLYEYCSITRSTRYKENRLAKITKSGYAQLLLTDTSLISAIRDKLLSLNLPVMSRKWDCVKKVDVRRDQLLSQRWSEVQMMLNNGMSRKEIAAEIGIRYQALNVFIWRRSA